MNPDSMLQAICRKENIAFEDAQPLSGGQINRVYQLGADLIVRLADAGPEAANHRLFKEAQLLDQIRNAVPVPQVVAVGELDGTVYQIQRRISGEKLYLVWGSLPYKLQERLMAELVDCLRAMHELPFEQFGRLDEPSPASSWLQYCESQFQAAMTSLQSTPNGLPPEALEMAAAYFAEHRHKLEKAAPVLVHADLWPGNILIANDSITAILDFEFALHAPRDYELLLIEDFCLYPNDFAEPGWERFSTADFSNYFLLLEKHYPELFATPYLRERLNLYHISFNLNLYSSWLRWHPERSREAPLGKAARLLNMLYGHGARMF